ncbi:MAG: nuclear transport factor 2 family protein [Myxococcota bacterium]|nr:nuclear transport factor 2 family protein [Myxococcales bacterium]
MPLSLQEISDRIEIQELLVRYSHCIDTRDFDGLDRVFTPDAHIDYTALGGSKGTLAETKAFLERSMVMFKSFQHMIANTVLELDGDRASARTICHNPMVMDRGGKEHVFVCGLWYVDELVRTADGWRIRQRVEERCYVDNMPSDLRPPV